MHPNTNTPVMALAWHVKHPLGADAIRLELFGYRRGGGVNFDSPHRTHLDLRSLPEFNDTNHPDLAAALGEALALHSLWGPWADKGRGVVVGLNCWQAQPRPESPITVELVGAGRPPMCVEGENIADQNYHDGLYATLRNLIHLNGEWYWRKS